MPTTDSIIDSRLIVACGKEWISWKSIASLTWAVISELVSYTGLEPRLLLL